MKRIDPEPEFTPITVVFESADEVNRLCCILNDAQDSGYSNETRAVAQLLLACFIKR